MKRIMSPLLLIAPALLGVDIYQLVKGVNLIILLKVNCIALLISMAVSIMLYLFYAYRKSNNKDIV